jgi:transposase-like protein
MLRQWQGSGLSIRAFCRKHNLAEPSFYAWRRTLAERDPVHPTRAKRDAAAHPALVECDRAARPAQRQTPSERRDRGRVSPLFVPLRVAASGFDPATLRQLLAVLEERPC